jgi:predicted metalloprotease with PDZ domain
MRRAILFAVCLAFAGITHPAASQANAASDTIHYSLGWTNPASQLYRVRVTAPAQIDSVVFSLPAWRPGRYILQNYAANVQSVRAHDEQGRPLPAEWIDLDSWRVDAGSARAVTLEYEYYASTFDAGSSTLSPDAAYFNPVNLLPWVEGRKKNSVTLTLEAPAEWSVATQLTPVSGQGHRFVAPDYDRLADSPTIAAGNLVVWDFDVDGVKYHLAFRPVRGSLSLGSFTRDQIIQDVSRLTRELVAVVDTAPFADYWHLFQLVPYPFGHAVEHESSASYVVSDRLFADANGYNGFLSIIAHELFHAWNVKRIRPAAMWPYDYSTPQLTRLHWVTEGVTSYYAMLVRARAGLLDEAGLVRTIAAQINSLASTPGRKVTSAELASLTSWHSGYGDGNPNKSLDFYGKGAALGLLLDLTIRDATDGARGLDDVMRLLWRQYYLQGKGYPEDGFQRAAEEVAGRSLETFFERYVRGTEELPWDSTLQIVGLTAGQEPNPEEPAATFGWRLGSSGGSIYVASVLPDGPALAAGVMRNDVLLGIDGERVQSPDLTTILQRHKPGDVVTVRLERVSGPREVRVTLGDGGNLQWTVASVPQPSARQARMRDSWLESRVDSQK